MGPTVKSLVINRAGVLRFSGTAAYHLAFSHTCCGLGFPPRFQHVVFNSRGPEVFRNELCNVDSWVWSQSCQAGEEIWQETVPLQLSVNLGKGCGTDSEPQYLEENRQAICSHKALAHRCFVPVAPRQNLLSSQALMSSRVCKYLRWVAVWNPSPLLEKCHTRHVHV